MAWISLYLGMLVGALVAIGCLYYYWRQSAKDESTGRRLQD